MRIQPRRDDGARDPWSVLAYDIETIAPALEDGSFPPWPSHQPVAVGFAQAWEQGGQWLFDIDALAITEGVTNEAAMIREADRRMAGAGVVTSYNGRQFDALVLRLAAQRQRLWDCKALADHAASKRFGGDHLDLADAYSSFGRKVSLASIADELGIAVKTDVAGGDVGQLWEAGEAERIRRYVMEDAVATLCVYFAWVAARNADEALVTRPLAALARHIEARADLAHLQPFLDCQLMWWARPRAMKADIGAALSRITHRLKQEESERAFAAS